MTRIIEVVVSPNGKTTIQTKGFAGSECREASKSIEEALGSKTHEQLTAEFYHRQSEQQDLREEA